MIRQFAVQVIISLFLGSAIHAEFNLITVLYNETNPHRRLEYIACLEKNISHPLVQTMHVLYDVSKDDNSNDLHAYLKQKNIKITYIHDRPTYGFCFSLANAEYPGQKVILCNADIYFNETLQRLERADLRGKFMALTRWDVYADGSLQLFKQYKPDGSFDPISYLSQDAWIFATPLNTFNNADFKLGTWACDSYIAYQAVMSGLEVCNPCCSIQACHLHLTQLRHWVAQSIPGAKALGIPWCTVENMVYYSKR